MEDTAHGPQRTELEMVEQRDGTGVGRNSWLSACSTQWWSTNWTQCRPLCQYRTHCMLLHWLLPLEMVEEEMPWQQSATADTPRLETEMLSMQKALGVPSRHNDEGSLISKFYKSKIACIWQKRHKISVRPFRRKEERGRRGSQSMQMRKSVEAYTKLPFFKVARYFFSQCAFRNLVFEDSLDIDVCSGRMLEYLLQFVQHHGQTESLSLFLLLYIN